MKKLLLVGSKDFIEKFNNIYKEKIDLLEVKYLLITDKDSIKNINEDYLNKYEKIIYMFSEISEDSYKLFDSLKDKIEFSYFFNLESINLKFKNNLHFGIPHISFNIITKKSLFLSIVEKFFALIILLLISPILVIVSLCIFFSDSLPIFFMQERVGLHGKIFTIYKFRTLKNSTPKYMKSSDKKSSYYIKIGLFLRKSNIDELPQFFNVLNGTMSFIGPRPEMPFIVDEYNFIEKIRLNVNPGITGPWQLSKAREREIHHNLEYDIDYIKNKNLITDLKLFLQTAFKSIR